MTPIHYRITPIHPDAHLFEVQCSIAEPAADGQRIALPAWIPGSYMIREFARNIVSISASSAGKPVALRKLDKHTWQAAPCKATLTLAWQVYAWDLSVRCAHLDDSHAFFNGTAVFPRVIGQEDTQHIVDIVRPDGDAYKRWRVATALPELKARRYGFGTYQAANYDELADHPVELGDFALASFDACGAQHDVVITGRVPNLDMTRLCADLKKICEAQIRLFEPHSARPPFDRYVFLTMAVGEGYGGLEHRASTALICTRNELPAQGQPELSDGYRGFLGLASHEYFHSWNVKRIKPAAFAPYDFERENHSSLLWIFEGFTSYYDDLILARAGLITPEQYLKLVARTIGTVLRGSGRLKQSVAESSFDAWTKYYRQDENAPNAIVSYYTKGSLVALALDLHLRHASKGRKSLDDAMRQLWLRFGRDFYPANAEGIGEDEFAAQVFEATGIDVTRQVRDWAYGTRDLPLAALFAPFGVDLTHRPEHERPTLGVKLAAGAECKLAQVFDGGAAQAAGLSAGDVLIAVDGLRVTSANLDTVLGRYAIGARVAVHAFRRDELQTRDVVLGAEPPIKTELTITKSARGRSWRRAWLGH